MAPTTFLRREKNERGGDARMKLTFFIICVAIYELGLISINIFLSDYE